MTAFQDQGLRHVLCTDIERDGALAGPNLTPQTFQAGMFAYPGGHGPEGYWHFGPGDYTPTDDFREIWWDPNRISAQNNRTGAWAQLNGGARYTSSSSPRGAAPEST